MVDQSQGGGDDLERFKQLETQRRTKTTAVGIIGVVLSVAAVALVMQFRHQIFRPKIDVEAGETQVLADTNDPQCRVMIERVGEVRDEFRALEKTADKAMLGEPADRAAFLERIDKLITKVAAIEATSAHANLRFDDSRSELDAWFKHVQVELGTFRRIASDIDAAAAGPPGEDAPTEAVQAYADETKARKAREKKYGSPQKRVERLLVATHDAFENFRVWHTSSLHPCGKADEGETPWAPPATTK